MITKHLYKVLAISIILLANYAASAQIPYDSVKKLIIYTGVEKVDGLTKDQLYDRGIEVLRTIYPNMDSKIFVKDKVKGEFVLKEFVKFKYLDPKKKTPIVDPNLIKYKFTLLYKDGRYKYDVSDFYIDKGYKYGMEKYYLKEKETLKDRPEEKLQFMDNEIRDIITRFNEGMKTGIVPEKKEEW
ncbi:MAG: DUF4468 domain-containing protein [Bacteroidota bacterium]|nr:DUF4468 domain-containing protein [Bacteroidota bacterium]